jgi:hypothetical protein
VVGGFVEVLPTTFATPTPTNPPRQEYHPMTEHPFGNPNGTTELPGIDKSIVDSVLNLDDFLAGDVRLALKQASFYTRPDLEAEIEELNAELDSLTDSQGRPLPVLDATVADGERSAAVVAQLVADKQREYAQSRRVIVMQQLDEDDWAAFQALWKDALAKDPPYPPEFYADLISKCALRPAIPADKVAEFRKKVGAPAYEEIWRAAWQVNTQSGVSIPKSLLSSAVLRLGQRG